MRLLKIDSPEPSNISYLWNFGSLLATCLIIQILTGCFLAMHYQAHVDFAFNSVEHIMRDVNNGWIIRYIHANVASFFFIFVYGHIGRNIYYGSYKSPRILVWSIGVIILILMMAIAFLGYVLPYGQMSLWVNLATVITNLLSAIPIFGQDLVELIWGGFSVSNATLNRFFSLHYILPFLLAALALAHLIALHAEGSDLITIFFFFLVLSIMVFYYPNFLGHSDNYIPANPMQTPASIVPEWYLLPFYAILRSIPNKLLGVLAMFDVSRIRGNQFRPAMKVAFWFFVVNFFILMWIGSQHPDSPYLEIGQISTAFYFIWFLFIIPLIGLAENTLMDIATESN
ncbi:hypothetical protein M404DRAFT_17375 [Pisolithus tinctorius Marx 270]|uniref:Cytochrome b n=1 Tax=Pisolithus tinctorius Marx 270 TaxID=870435 RepID=A0A0C3J588_PISTI|nr:hypothetical protein M404DRAFT_17375 [Pisolithus tinctorius Marx 270]